MKIGAAFFPLFSAAEVALRNLIAARLHAVYGVDWWGNPALILLLGGRGKGIVLRAVKKLELRGVPVDDGRLTAELSFGFWENMLLPKYSVDLWTPLHPHFPDLPDQFSQADLFDRIAEICSLRNRISHHEPIFDRDLSRDYARTMDLIRWLCIAKAEWIKPHCDVMTLLRRKP